MQIRCSALGQKQRDDISQSESEKAETRSLMMAEAERDESPWAFTVTMLPPVVTVRMVPRSVTLMPAWSSKVMRWSEKVL